MRFANFLFCFSFALGCIAPQAFSQTANCSDAAGGQLPVGSTCNVFYFDSDNNSDYWDGASGCGAADLDDVWGWFVATNNYITIQYNPVNNQDPIINVFDGTVGNCATNMASIMCVNDFPTDGTESITFPTVPGQRYRVRAQLNGGNATMLGDACIVATATPPPVNTVCTLPNPICSGTPISFIANAGGNSAHYLNPGNQYGCLSTTPNPSWYYMEIDQSGNLAINITAGSDVDFRLWGPFASLAAAQAGCNSYGAAADCSYSTSATEQANAVVTAGQVWVLLVTNYANTVQTISINEAGSNTASTNCAIVPLPVGYTQWDAQYIDRKVVLTWATDIEEDNEQFIVQRSDDGLIWETIGVVAGNGTSSEDHDYQFIDEKPVQDISYYRLMQVDFNGTPSYTSILSVNTEKGERFAVYPNPAKNSFHVRSGNKSVEKLTITNTVGKSFPLAYTEAEGGLSVDCSHLAPGIYTLTVIAGNAVQSERLVISE